MERFNTEELLHSIAERKRNNLIQGFVKGNVNAEDDGVNYEVDEEDVEKSDILESISGCGSKIDFTKTGKEIKEQISSVVLPELNAKLESVKHDAEEKLKECDGVPTKDPDIWWTGGVKIDSGFKIFSWDETYYTENKGDVAYSVGVVPSNEEDDKKIPKSPQIAKSRYEYNELVHMICNVVTDIKACEILMTVKDNKSYDLTTRQMIALKFN